MSTDSLELMHSADPALDAAPMSLRAADIRRLAQEPAGEEPGPTRRRRPSRRMVLIGAAALVAAIAVLIPMANPFAPSQIGKATSNSAFAVDPHPDGTVQVDLTMAQLFTPRTAQDLQRALEDAGIRAVVMRASAHGTCSLPDRDGLLEMGEFEPPDLVRPPTNGVEHFTFRPSAMLADAYLFVVVPPAGTDLGSSVVSFGLQRGTVPACVNYGVGP